MTEILESKMQGYDLCVVCGKPTKYPINVTVQIRYGYV